MKAEVAWRAGVPVLTFYFLIHRVGRMWAARSMLTGHVAESATASGAFENLTKAIDAAIDMADRRGITAEQWYRAQQPAELEYLVMFIAAVKGHEVKQTCERAPSGRFFLDAQMLEAA